MLKAFLDASGTDPTKDIIVVGGWVATKDSWAEFEPQWQTFLVDCFGPNGGRWHHTDFHSRRKQYEDWDDQKRDRAGAELCRIIGALKPIAIGTALRKTDYNELWQTNRWVSTDRWSGDPDTLCMDECLEVLTHRIHQHPYDEGVQIIVDRDEKKGLSRRIYAWHKKYLSNNEHARYPGRRVDFDHGSDRDYLPLQAADRSRERNVPLHAEQIPECGDRKDACPFPRRHSYSRSRRARPSHNRSAQTELHVYGTPVQQGST